MKPSHGITIISTHIHMYILVVLFSAFSPCASTFSQLCMNLHGIFTLQDTFSCTQTCTHTLHIPVHIPYTYLYTHLYTQLSSQLSSHLYTHLYTHLYLYTLQISDFGMSLHMNSERIHQKERLGAIPLKWTSPEVGLRAQVICHTYMFILVCTYIVCDILCGLCTCCVVCVHAVWSVYMLSGLCTLYMLCGLCTY